MEHHWLELFVPLPGGCTTQRNEDRKETRVDLAFSLCAFCVDDSAEQGKPLDLPTAEMLWGRT